MPLVARPALNGWSLVPADVIWHQSPANKRGLVQATVSSEVRTHTGLGLGYCYFLFERSCCRFFLFWRFLILTELTSQSRKGLAFKYKLYDYCYNDGFRGFIVGTTVGKKNKELLGLLADALTYCRYPGHYSRYL